MRSVGSIAASPYKFRLPRFTPNTPTYNDEGTGTSGWTMDNATLSQPDASTVRITQTTAGGANGKMYRAITMPVTNKDWVFYLRCRCRKNSSDTHRFTIQSVTGAAPGAPRLHIYFNFNTTLNSGNGLAEEGTMSLRYTNSGGSHTNAVVATGVSYDTQWQDLVLAYCSKFNTFTCEFRGASGWTYKTRVACIYMGAQLDIVTNNASVSGAWFEFDFITLASPNIIAIGDSSTAGYTLFAPDPAAGLTDGTSRIWHECPIYLDVRNNYIMNKGVASDTSALVAGRIQADALDNGPKLVILGACNNDNASISHADRTTNIQTSVTAIGNAGAKCILLNASYRTSTTPVGGQPAYRDYYRDWWTQYRGTVSGIHAYANRMTVLRDANEYHDPAYAQADGGHSNVAGYRRTKQQLAGITVT